jgi:hypothetical protein
MGVVISPDSELGKELLRWEQHRTRFVPEDAQPGNPYVFRPYPRMVFRAQLAPGGQTRCLLPPPNPYEFTKPDEFERAVLQFEAFNRSCCRIVQSESEHRMANGQGWADSPAEALGVAEKEAQAIGNAAAEAIATAKRMSAKAQDEFAEASAETHQHVTDVVGASKKTRGRPKKTQPVTEA